MLTKHLKLLLKEILGESSLKIKITQADIDERGSFIKDLPLPENTLVVMVKRGGKYFVPKGRTELFDGDNLLLITDNQDVLMKTLSASGISYNNIKTEKIENNSIIDDIKSVTPVDTIKKRVGRIVGK